MLKLTTQEEAVQFIQERLNTREWWLIVAASQMGTDLAQVVEEAFYDGKGEFFDMLMVPAVNKEMPPMSALFFARKQEMTPEQLSTLIHDESGANVELDGTQDIVLTPDAPLSVVEWLWETFR